ncbi:MAG: hypothetical protein J0I54_01590 [Bosea sp.]|uniref:hypothetical protein n=1 Tax=unclassified Bosea (in: a-proteobacteria) TaxID=2653178 RepID=UPI00095CF8F3|nr:MULTISPECIES: hypothetical protein [unclassified Bosea (in: a-proteobacteria)]MBN9455297.1 hypothetical protein [Bosea sp. (in: a-proteobacteria)]OJV04922.1 MAG: hypothetical protein BGO20_17380 [Bosea sp. 67-29]
MTAEVVDLAARRSERDAKEREAMEGALYGVADWGAPRGWEFFAELRSGQRITLADGLPPTEAWERFLEAVRTRDARATAAG